MMVEQVIGAVSCAGIWLRRRWPVGFALALVPVSWFSALVSGPTLVALFTVAVHRPFRHVALVGGLYVLCVLPYAVLRPDPELGVVGLMVLGVSLYLALVAWGMFIRARRQLVLSLRDRAERASEEAKRLERERIAREMHDVLAHRLSLLSVHAGALAFRRDMPREDVSRAAEAIRHSAHQALQDLRAVIGVLRHGDDGDAPQPPQPTLADLPGLVEESRKAGTPVRLALRLADPAAVPDALGRTAYRIAQEGLTNARKHAPGSPVRVEVDGAPGDGLTVVLRNPVRAPARQLAHVVPFGGDASGPAALPIPGSGTGLIGLAERVSLAGGRLEHGVSAADAPGAGEDEFRLRAWLPWPAAAAA
ncbi:sensor histidine kinase [Thermocatellispora tengchongensis]